MDSQTTTLSQLPFRLVICSKPNNKINTAITDIIMSMCCERDDVKTMSAMLNANEYLVKTIGLDLLWVLDEFSDKHSLSKPLKIDSLQCLENLTIVDIIMVKI